MATAAERPVDLNSLGLPALYRELSRTGLVRRVLEARVRSDQTDGRIRPEELATAATSVGRPW